MGTKQKMTGMRSSQDQTQICDSPETIRSGRSKSTSILLKDLRTGCREGRLWELLVGQEWWGRQGEEPPTQSGGIHVGEIHTEGWTEGNNRDRI